MRRLNWQYAHSPGRLLGGNPNMLNQHINSDLYGYPLVGRFGLGHSLLAWARCWTWCQQHGVPMLAPNWRHIRLGPWLRGERDNRQYQRLFDFHDYVTGPRRLWLLNTGKQWSAEHDDLDKILADRYRGVVVFRNRVSMNEETHFHEVIGNGPALGDALTAMTRPAFRPRSHPEPHVALHVRMGDFEQPVSVEALRAGAKNSRLPVRWYQDMLIGLRERLGDVPAIVYSDGDDAALADLLKLPNVLRSPHQPSVTDMLSIAQATVLISSGSGFSTWGSFLGDVPRICFPGQRFVRVLGDSINMEREPEAEDAEELTPAFVSYLANRISDQSVC